MKLGSLKNPVEEMNAMLENCLLKLHLFVFGLYMSIYNCYYESDNETISKIGINSLIQWLQEDKNHQNTLCRNSFFASAPSILSVEVERNGGEEEKREVERKTKILQLYCSLIRGKIILTRMGEVLHEAEKIREEIKRREESGNKEVDEIWDDLDDTATTLIKYAKKAGIEKKEWIEKNEYERRIEEMNQRIKTLEEEINPLKSSPPSFDSFSSKNYSSSFQASEKKSSLYSRPSSFIQLKIPTNIPAKLCYPPIPNHSSSTFSSSFFDKRKQMDVELLKHFPETKYDKCFVVINVDNNEVVPTLNSLLHIFLDGLYCFIFD